MSRKESLIKWLNLYDKFDIEDFIESELVENDGGFALAKEPNTVEPLSFVDGSGQKSEYYTFQAKLPIVTDGSRLSHDEFFEEFEDWIFNKNLNGDLPTLDKAFCDNVAISSSYYLQSNEDKLGMYIFTIELTFRKEI